jgi:hypothetical protein
LLGKGKTVKPPRVSSSKRFGTPFAGYVLLRVAE